LKITLLADKGFLPLNKSTFFFINFVLFLGYIITMVMIRWGMTK